MAEQKVKRRRIRGAWVTREWNEAGKRRREKLKAMIKRPKKSDCFVVEWINPAGKRCREKTSDQEAAFDRAAFLTQLLNSGQYEEQVEHDWPNFRERFEQKVLCDKGKGNQRCTRNAMDHFERLIKPKKMKSIKSETIAEYKAKRRQEAGNKPGSKVSMSCFRWNWNFPPIGLA